MAITNFHSTRDLKAVDYGGVIREDVMNEIFDISRIPLPFTDAVGSGTCDNTFTEWMESELAPPNVNNAAGETQTITQNDVKNAERIGNRCQISVKQVGVTERAQAVDTIGYSDELAYQIMRRQQELRRDVEAILLTNQGSEEGATEADPDFTAALGACITQGSITADSTGGGYSGTDWAARVPGTKQPLTEKMVRDACQLVYEEGGDPTILMSVPTIIRSFSEYCFTESARIATLTAETSQRGPATAMGSVNIFISDFGSTLSLVPNRLQQPFDSEGGTPNDAANAYLLDPNYAEVAYLQGYTVSPMAKTSMSETRLMHVDYVLKVLNRKAHAILADLDLAAAVTFDGT